MKTVYLLHAWGGSPDGAFRPYLKKELEKQGICVIAPAFPDTNHPCFETWIPFLHKTIVRPDEETIVVAHSLAALAMLHFLSELKENQRIGKLIIVAGVIGGTITNFTPEEREIYSTWEQHPINYSVARTKADKIIAFFSDNDKYIPLDAVNIAKNELHARVIIEHDMEHYSKYGDVTETPSIVEAVLN